ncbi:MAG TPA: hypothetical protein DIT99_24020 [Candidatus Latescibacteria bacterium]|nr:hypothetical protein [Candidatus Latescibacterota bacterium]
MPTRSSNWEQLKHLNPFILDNSIRETVVGNIRAQTLEDKLKVFQMVTDTGFSEIILASFGRYPRTDDFFMEELSRKGLIRPGHYVFSELFDTFIGDRPAPDKPKGFRIAEQYGVVNLLIEIDICTPQLEDCGGVKIIKELVELRSRQFQEMPRTRHLFFNIRDYNMAMLNAPEDVEELVAFIASLAKSIRPKGMLVEDSAGSTIPYVFGEWIASMVDTARAIDWPDMDLLVHVHRGYGLSEAIVLESLANGATSLWAGMSETGAGVGHASSIMTLANLARLGNNHVLDEFNLKKLREVGCVIYEMATNAPIPYAAEIFSDQTFELILAGGFGQENEPSRIFGMNQQFRMSELAGPAMIHDRLKALSSDLTWDVLTISLMSKEMPEYLKYNQDLNLDSSATILYKYICASGDVPDVLLTDFLNRENGGRAQTRWEVLKRHFDGDYTTSINEPLFLCELSGRYSVEHWNFEIDGASSIHVHKKLGLDQASRSNLIWALLVEVILARFGAPLSDADLSAALVRQIFVPEFMRLFDNQSGGLIEATAANLETDEIDHPLLYNLSPNARREVLNMTIELKCEAGSVICRKGDLGDQFYKILKGRCTVFGDRECTEHISELNEGSFFGELAVFRQAHRQASVVAVKDSVLAAFPSPLDVLTGDELSEFKSSIDQLLDVYDSWYQSKTMRRIGLNGFLRFILFGKIITLPAGHLTIRKGDLPENLYFIITGKVEIEVD